MSVVMFGPCSDTYVESNLTAGSIPSGTLAPMFQICNLIPREPALVSQWAARGDSVMAKFMVRTTTDSASLLH